MKNLTIIFFLFSLPVFAAEKCNLLYSDKKIELCGTIINDEKIGNKPLYSIYGKFINNGSRFLISEEVDLEEIKNTKSLGKGLYYYKATLGGNSVNAENRHVLILVKENNILNAGKFSKIIRKKAAEPKFYTFVISKEGKDHAVDEYEQKELVLKNNKLVLK